MPLPTWAIIYLVIFAVITAIDAALPDDDPKWWRACEFVAHLALIIVFCAHWVARDWKWAPVLAFLGLAWEVYSTPSDFQKLRNDPDMSVREVTGLIVVGSVIALPLYATAFAALIDVLWDRT
jgi:hypothetical protein